MSGTGTGDELALLIASFVEEVKPFFAGIRRGVAGIFAMPRDAQAISAARSSLGTIAASAKVLDLPAARQLAELAQLLGEAFEAAERGGVPDESRAPMLTMVDHLEGQLDGLETGDDRGRERLDNSYRLLEQVLQTVEEAEAAPPSAMEIGLDDLLLTLQPAAAPAPAPAPLVEVAPELEPIPEPTQTELVLLAEEEVAPIEWGEKEAILWNKGGWDERQTAYGNTEWIFLDEEDITTVQPAAARPAAPAPDQDTDRVIEAGVTAPLLNMEGVEFLSDAPLAREAAEESAEAAEAIAAPEDLDFAEPALTGELSSATADELLPAMTGDLPPMMTGALSSVALDAEAIEEAALLALSADDLETYLSLEGAAQQAFLLARYTEMADFATDLGIAIDPHAVAGRDTGDLSALLTAPVGDTGQLTPDVGPSATTDALIAPVGIRPTSRSKRRRTSDILPGRTDGTDRLLSGGVAGLGPKDVADEATDEVQAEQPVAAEPAPEQEAGPTAPLGDPSQWGDQLLHVAITDEAPVAEQPAGADGMDRADEQAAPIDGLLLTEYRPTDHGTGSLDGSSGTDNLTRALEEAELARAERLATDRLSLAGRASGGTSELPSHLVPDDPYEDEEEGSSFLDDLLDEDPAEQQQLVAASDQLFEDTGELDPNFAALPDVAPEIEAAFARLSEADITIFLTLDGDAALAFLQRRTSGTDAVVAPEAMPVEELPEVLAVPLEGQEPHDDVLAWSAGDELPAAAEVPAAGLSSLSIDQEILEVFLQEAQELLVDWGTTATKLRRAPADAIVMADLRRTAHTLKGAANMMGFTTLGAAGWRVEHLLDLLDEHGLTVAAPVLDFVDRTYALVQRMSADATADPRAFTGESAALEALHDSLAADIAAGTLDTTPRASEDLLDTPLPAARGQHTPEPAAFDDEVIDGELLDVFVQEAEDHLGAFNRALVALDRRPSDTAQLNEAKRVVHTLKGASAALGYPVTAALCHSIEDLFSVLDESGREPSREMMTLFFESAEALEALVAGITAGRGEDAGRADALRARYAAFLGARGEGQPPLGVVQRDRLLQAVPAAEAPPEEALRPENAPRSVRVDIAHLDNLLNLVGELVINRTGQEQHLERLGRTVAELLLSVDRLRRVGFQLESRYEVAELLRSEGRGQAVLSRQSAVGSSAEGSQGIGLSPFPLPIADRRLTTIGPAPQGEDEFDALEMDRYTELHRISRELVEIAADINAAGNELDGLYDAFDQTLSRQGRIATDLQDRMMEVRLVPLSTIAARLYRAVRGVATRRGRATELVIEGEKVEIDKVLLEEITDPLLHLVRNAADHGIESPEDRRRRGKPATGTIRLVAAREGNEAVIRVHDDGAGIDLDQVLDKALARGIIRRRDGLTREQILDLIFLPGFSTSPVVSDISGRGVGLDVVRTNVTRLKGTIDVESTLGVGTTFTIRLPIMLAVTRALLVRSGAQTFAIPLPVVEQVAFFRKDLVNVVGTNEIFDLGGEAYPVLYLNRALGLGGSSDLAGSARALIVGNADRRIALVVDELVGQQEVVVKRLGRHLQSVAGVAGATILGSGQVVLILNVLDLIGARRTAGRRPGALGAAVEGVEGQEHQPRRPGPGSPISDLRPSTFDHAASARVAMVVDDSLSVRRVLTRTLERDGWQVLGAKDGVEALEMLAWTRPQVMILDIEMPRMDGYELTNLIRNHPEHHALPIAMLTSRAGEKHRRKAFDLGVSAYLVKPFEETELLRTVRELSGAARRQTVG